MCRTLQKHKGKGTSLPPDGPEREEALAERKRYIEAEKETEISNQLLPTLWAIDCMKFMMGGTLIKSPALREFESRRRQDKNLNGTTEAFRVLNLGGAPSCDWGWAIAITVPESEVTTVMHNSQNITPEIEGPKNHESMVVPHLWRLPFEDSSFDLISARSLHLYLRTQAPIGEVKDEYDLVLKECLRVLKPGGYLEYALPDCDIKGAGDQGTAISQTLADDLQELGYDPHPMSLIDKRLSDTGFIVPASAKIFLPMGPRLRSTTDGTDAPPEDISQKTEEAESSRTLSCISGLLGARIWEQWLLKVQMETGKDKAARLDEAMPILEEERPEDLTGWEVMMGWAKKPTQKKVAWA
ncbi:hypothetical protein KEM55_005799 [Ascosphaera atra]|nr:hypothetical protein KEM55_005799 [Ascosphaera atra]